MSENKSSISKQTTYLGIGDYWDTRELDESFFTGPDLEVQIELEHDPHYFAIETEMLRKISNVAKKQGIGPSTLVKKWISEKVAELPSR